MVSYGIVLISSLERDRSLVILLPMKLDPDLTDEVDVDRCSLAMRGGGGSGTLSLSFVEEKECDRLPESLLALDFDDLKILSRPIVRR